MKRKNGLRKPSSPRLILGHVLLKTKGHLNASNSVMKRVPYYATSNFYFFTGVMACEAVILIDSFVTMLLNSSLFSIHVHVHNPLHAMSLHRLAVEIRSNDISVCVLFFNRHDWTSAITTLLSEVKERIGTDELGRKGFRR
jgi:hypothetical protein